MVPIGMTDLGDAVRKHQDGAILNIFVTTGADTNVFPAGYDRWRKRVEIRVSSPPKDNMANMDVIKTSADFFNKTVEKVTVVSGKKSRKKTILVKGISVDNAVKKLKESLNGL